MDTEDRTTESARPSPPDSVGTPAEVSPEGPAASASDTIATRQNEAWSIQLLAAQRQLYSEAKAWRRVRAWGVSAMAVIGVGTALLAPDLLKIIGPIGAAFAIAQWLGLLIEKQRTKTAANIQEQFDTSIYPLEWNPVLGAKTDPEDVVAAAQRFRGERAQLVDWYSIPHGVPRPLDVLLAQRSNLRWDAALRRAYANAILAAVLVLFVLVIAVGLVRSLSLGDFLLALLPSVGAFLLGAETVRSHRQHASAQSDLKRKVETAWERARANPRDVRDQDLRAIQDGIHQLRAIAPPVPDRFYWSRRGQFEREMRAAAERLWEEARQSA